MKKAVVVFSITCFSIINFSMGQLNSFISNFKVCVLPFTVNASTFDIYASEEPYVISENDIISYLLMDNDTFVNIKASSLKNPYPKYMAVGRFKIYDELLGILYFRNIISNDNEILELMLCILNKKGKLISTYPISGYCITENKKFYSTIFNENNIEILFYNLDTHDYINKNIIEKKHIFITKEGMIQEK